MTWSQNGEKIIQPKFGLYERGRIMLDLARQNVSAPPIQK